MDRVVIDSSVAIKWFFTEPDSAQAHELLAGHQAGALELLAPDLIYTEVANICWKRHQFQGIAAHDAQQVVQAFRTIRFQVTTAVDLLDDALSLAMQHGRTVYDSLYLALMVREGCRFVTADARLANSLASILPDIVPLAAYV